jgi:carbamoyl-phosphate synthase large subunit
VLPVLRLTELGYRVVATEGTGEVLARNGIASETVRKFSEDHKEGESVVDMLDRGEVDIVVNTPTGGSTRHDGYEIRAAAVAADKPLFTTISELSAAVASIDAVRAGFDVKSLQEYQADRVASRAAAAGQGSAA